jgi:hypothetical protein
MTEYDDFDTEDADSVAVVVARAAKKNGMYDSDGIRILTYFLKKLKARLAYIEAGAERATVCGGYNDSKHTDEQVKSAQYYICDAFLATEKYKNVACRKGDSIYAL